MFKITNSKQDCCGTSKTGGFKSGLVYGLLPHSVCIGFILASVIGATVATTVFRRLLLVPNFFQILIALSFIFATISAIIYLKKCGQLTSQGIKNKWRYLVVLYGTTVGINLIFFRLIFPAMANLNFAKTGPAQLALKVEIPCSGHAPLITDELKKVQGVSSVNYKFPDIFEISFEKSQVSSEKILDLEIFKSFRAKIL